MSPKLFSLNSLMERKRKPKPQENKDELALVKKQLRGHGTNMVQNLKPKRL
jgi:hypothetical protein